MSTLRADIPSYLVTQRAKLVQALQVMNGDVYIYLPPTTVNILYEYDGEPPRTEIFQVPAQHIPIYWSTYICFVI